jgi:hypothetical protein
VIGGLEAIAEGQPVVGAACIGLSFLPIVGSRVSKGLRAAFGKTARHSDELAIAPKVNGVTGNGLPIVAAPATSSKPEWLRRLDAGNDFNRTQGAKYASQGGKNEVYVVNPDGNGYYRVDSYNPRTGEIVSRKYTQLSEVQEATGVKYINELAKKYSPGTVIADVPSSGWLAGQRLQGQMILEVPVQTNPIPKAVLDAANQKGIIIRDINGKVY